MAVVRSRALAFCADYAGFMPSIANPSTRLAALLPSLAVASPSPCPGEDLPRVSGIFPQLVRPSATSDVAQPWPVSSGAAGSGAAMIAPLGHQADIPAAFPVWKKGCISLRSEILFAGAAAGLFLCNGGNGGDSQTTSNGRNSKPQANDGQTEEPPFNPEEEKEKWRKLMEDVRCKEERVNRLQSEWEMKIDDASVARKDALELKEALMELKHEIKGRKTTGEQYKEVSKVLDNLHESILKIETKMSAKSSWPVPQIQKYIGEERTTNLLFFIKLFKIVRSYIKGWFWWVLGLFTWYSYEVSISKGIRIVNLKYQRHRKAQLKDIEKLIAQDDKNQAALKAGLPPEPDDTCEDAIQKIRDILEDLN